MLRHFSKVVSWCTLFLIFAGGMVTSTGSGLAVPDWPLSYGTLFPPMIGGVFYEHGHRMIASLVGFLTLVLVVWIAFKDDRAWVKAVGFCALGAVILQGVLGGLTVLFFLPTPISVAHGVLAQTFFLMTIFIAYSFSNQRKERLKADSISTHLGFVKWTTVFLFCIYMQLIFGAIMRHTGSGLAIGDFPTMGGQWFPDFGEGMMSFINDWRFEQGLDAVMAGQVAFHLMHRVGAAVLLCVAVVLNVIAFKGYKNALIPLKTLLALDGLILIQVSLGVASVLMLKPPVLTSLHVVTGAGILGVTFMLLLKSAPLGFRDFRLSLFSNGVR